MASTLLAALLQDWRLLLTEWSLNGILSRAAQDALRLPGEPVALQQLVKRWSVGDFKGLPSVVVLAGTAMPSAAGAYAIATNTIYLNADWLRHAGAEQVLDVLNEELGHYLDALLNGSDTPGDEGELFALLLHGHGSSSEEQQQALLLEDDRGFVRSGAQELLVEQASRVVSTPIPEASPGRTRYEWVNAYAVAAIRNDGSVITWGDPLSGGDSSNVDFDGPHNNLTVTQIYSSRRAFAALRSDGSVVSWGESGGDSSGVDFNGPSDNLAVTRIFSTAFAFAALRSDGSIVTWGDTYYGGNSNGVDFDGPSNNLSVTQVFSNASAFAALSSEGSVVPCVGAG